MNKISTSIYYDSTFGYIVVSYTKYINGGPDRVINPVLHVQALADSNHIGNCILEGLEKTRVAERVTPESLQGYKFWQISGIKSFSAFSKRFRFIDIDKTDSGYEFTERKRDIKGAYAYSKDDTTIYLPLNASVETIGKTVSQILFKEIADLDNTSMNFTTVHGNEVSYTRPSDDFEDAGDGHTDAYQIYIYDSNDKNYIAFLLDNGYSDYTENAIRQRWQQMYGTLLEFNFQTVTNMPEKIQVSGKTKNEMIISHIYQDEEGMLEVLYEIDLIHTSEKEKEELKKEFEKVISSIKIQ